MKQLALLALLVPCLLAAADAPKKPADKKPSPVNAVCPVSDHDADAAHTATHQGKLIAFCCEECVDSFKKSPDKFMKKVEAEQAKNKKSEKPQKKGEQPAADKNAPANKLCPVEPEHAVDPTVATATYKGKTVGFCCDDCVKKFDLDPDTYGANLK